MMSSSKKFLCIFKIKFPTKRIFRIFPILRINGMAPFCNLFIERPSYNFFLALPNFLSAHSHFPCSLVNRRSSYSLSTNHLSCGFQSSSYSELCFRKPPPSAMPSADWFQHRDVTRRGSASDARTTQISSQNIHASRKASTQANAMQQLLSY